MNRTVGLFIVLCVQILCAAFFVGGIAVSVFGLAVPPIDWAVYEWIEIAASTGLVVSVIVIWILLRQSLQRTEKAETIVTEISGAFMDLVSARFDEWDLTPAQRDVALFLIKGMSTSEMASLRGTSDGTVKAQTNAIYRKADVTSRAQLVSLLIDDLMQDDVLPCQPGYTEENA